MKIIVADLEGVFFPEIWINVAKKTGIEELKLTTRDISDYDALMTKRLLILKENNLKIQDVKDVVAALEPLDGALEFLDWVRKNSQIIVLSDTFEEFARPLMAKLKYPTLLCHKLNIDAGGNIVDYDIRIPAQKKEAVKALQGINYHVIAFGDSYNDIDMIRQADQGFLFMPPESVIHDYPKLPVTRNYRELKNRVQSLLETS